MNYYLNYLTMIMTYSDCVAKYGSDYKLKKEIESGRLFQIEKGLYSDSKYHSDKELISVKYPKAVLGFFNTRRIIEMRVAINDTDLVLLCRGRWGLSLSEFSWDSPLWGIFEFLLYYYMKNKLYLSEFAVCSLGSWAGKD